LLESEKAQEDGHAGGYLPRGLEVCKTIISFFSAMFV
jgi:hypothetical protein